MECLAGCSRATAARAALTGQRTHTPTSVAGMVEALPVLRATRGSAVKSRRAGLQALHNRIVEAAAELRDQLRHTQITGLVNQIAPELTAAIGIGRELAAAAYARGALAYRGLRAHSRRNAG
ncbi:hypothetical protein ABN028_24100 [Actinopolymorpha sp. B17G11]|uniref:hypothetical protein n=1 Tax=Actinopolymorpha sp. B17G11 TaxID=3160861 RepID=UPI0032E48089